MGGPPPQMGAPPPQMRHPHPQQSPIMGEEDVSAQEVGKNHVEGLSLEKKKGIKIVKKKRDRDRDREKRS
ncbi:hypothetical protein EVAR_72812_1 [Eumeta japonica]|uniref:Uncharacterized protein n=1 Tax=Eumeta variegata TaxID=151549 RepID=A0A4C1SYC1_EUMVA|nr:hypothetical protein EVAR_72812_1 [Eumeta japonica]